MNKTNAKKTAIYGGSFDPIHNGHIALAGAAVRECSLDRLIFMPAYISPFKRDSKVTDGRDRCGMIRAALGLNDAFCISEYELRKGGEASYTIETLEYFGSILGGEPSFVLGFDSIVQLDTWYRGEEILRGYHIITCRRPDTDDAAGIEKIGLFRERYEARITLLDMPPVDVSSTQIRKLASEGKSLEGLVPEGVEKYIKDHGLYI